MMFDKITDKWMYLIAVAMFAVLLAVADMNWPTHMGPQGVLVDHVMTFVSSTTN